MCGWDWDAGEPSEDDRDGFAAALDRERDEAEHGHDGGLWGEW